jgi:oxygen-independent coproporphyrinogen-3 oxidase
MFSFPNQTMDELKEDVNALTQFNSEHLSLYTLTIEKNSKFYAQNIQLQDDDDQVRKYTFVCDALKAKGFEQYEVSNFSKPAKASAHNLNYWLGNHYIGLGIGAHSHIGAKRSWNISKLTEYISRMEKGLSVEGGSEALTPYHKMKETVLFGLRMNRGVDISQITERFDCFLGDKELKKIDQFIEGGFLVKDNGVLKASADGRLVLDELCARLV